MRVQGPGWATVCSLTVVVVRTARCLLRHAVQACRAYRATSSGLPVTACKTGQAIMKRRAAERHAARSRTAEAAVHTFLSFSEVWQASWQARSCRRKIEGELKMHSEQILLLYQWRPTTKPHSERLR